MRAGCPECAGRSGPHVRRPARCLPPTHAEIHHTPRRLGKKPGRKYRNTHPAPPAYADAWQPSATLQKEYAPPKALAMKGCAAPARHSALTATQSRCKNLRTHSWKQLLIFVLDLVAAHLPLSHASANEYRAWANQPARLMHCCIRSGKPTHQTPNDAARALVVCHQPLKP